MSSLENLGTSYTIQVANTYPATVTCTVSVRSTSGGPMPLLPLTLPPSSIQSPGSGDTLTVAITYPDPVTGNPVTVNMPYGSPMVPGQPINCMWYTGPESQIVVIVETQIVDPGP